MCCDRRPVRTHAGCLKGTLQCICTIAHALHWLALRWLPSCSCLGGRCGLCVQCIALHTRFSRAQLLSQVGVGDAPPLARSKLRRLGGWRLSDEARRTRTNKLQRILQVASVRGGESQRGLEVGPPEAYAPKRIDGGDSAACLQVQAQDMVAQAPTPPRRPARHAPTPASLSAPRTWGACHGPLCVLVLQCSTIFLPAVASGHPYPPTICALATCRRLTVPTWKGPAPSYVPTMAYLAQSLILGCDWSP